MFNGLDALNAEKDNLDKELEKKNIEEEERI